jgi:hypothetical protein
MRPKLKIVMNINMKFSNIMKDKINNNKLFVKKTKNDLTGLKARLINSTKIRIVIRIMLINF